MVYDAHELSSDCEQLTKAMKFWIHIDWKWIFDNVTWLQDPQTILLRFCFSGAMLELFNVSYYQPLKILEIVTSY